MKAFIQLLRYMRPYILFAILGPFLMFVEVAMDLLQPTLMQKMIDDGIANANQRYVIQLGLFMLLSAIIGLIGGMGSSIYAAKAAVHFATDIRDDLFKKVNGISNEVADSYGIGKLITIVSNDVTSVQHAIMMTLRVFVRGPLLFIGSVLIVWFTARPLFPIVLVVIPLLIVSIYYFSVRIGKLFLQVQQAIDRMNTKLQEMFAAIRVVKAFNREEYEKSQFRKLNQTWMERNMRAEQFMIALMPIMMFIINIAIVAGLWLGVIKVNEGTVQIGVILAFINYLTIMLNGILTSSHVLMVIARAFPSAERMLELLKTRSDLTGNSDVTTEKPIRGDVEFQNVSFRYDSNGKEVLKDISFSVKAGETVGIIGPTGSGKSTLVKLIARLYDPDRGTIFIDGIDMKDYPLKKLREAIGFVPQKATLFSGSIADNLRFGKEKATIADMEEAAQLAVAAEFIHRFDEKFDYELLQGATNVSGGQKQRLSIARALIRKPAILIFDDSTSAIDAYSEAKVLRAIKETFTESTVFIISSKISSVIDADQILVLKEGKLVASGSHDELLQRSRDYQTMYAAQLGKGVFAYEKR